jgi:predicted PurR-regulated permease PerM
MSLIDVRTVRVLFTALLFAVILSFLYAARQTLMAFLFAIFFAYLMDHAVSHIEK